MISTPLSAIEVVSRLDAAARRGKMPGFEKGAGGTGGDGPLFTVKDFGTPFESVLAAFATPAGTGCELRFERKLKPLMPWVFGALLVATVWPGVWLTESLLRTYLPGTNLYTYWWYLPLTVPFVPLGLIRALGRSAASGRAEAEGLIERIRGHVEGRAGGAGGGTGG